MGHLRYKQGKALYLFLQEFKKFHSQTYAFFQNHASILKLI